MTGTDDFIELSERRSAHNYHPLPVVVARGAGRLGRRRGGPAVPRLPGRLLRPELRARQPEDHRGGAGAAVDRLTLTSRAFYHDQFADLRRRAGRPDRQGHGAADEHRRRGRGDRASRWPASGATRSRASPPTRPTSSWRRTTSTAGPRRSSASPPTPTARGGFGPYTPGFRIVPYGDRRGARGGRRRQHGRGADRAHPGRGRGAGPAATAT